MAYMDPKLVRQFIIFLVVLFGWTVVILLAGPK
jgi:phage shock protein PspC (stress-responsive transcriptional regulator)